MLGDGRHLIGKVDCAILVQIARCVVIITVAVVIDLEVVPVPRCAKRLGCMSLSNIHGSETGRQRRLHEIC